jgi:hypothetical protein
MTLMVFVTLVGCGDDGGGGGGDGGGADSGVDGGQDVTDGDVDDTPAPVAPGAYTYTLTDSPAGLPLWTTPTARKVRPGDLAPDETRAGLSMSAARHEFEPAQLLIGPAERAAEATVSIAPFPELGAGARLTLRVAGYTDTGWPETLTPLDATGAFSIAADRATALWIEVYVPPSAPAGEHTTELTLTTADGETTRIPVTLYVYDFALPALTAFKTQLNVSISDLIPPRWSGHRRDDRAARAPLHAQVDDVAERLQPLHHLGELGVERPLRRPLG